MIGSFDATWFSLLALALVAIAGSALFSGAETGIYAVNRLRLELRRSDDPGDRAAQRLGSFLDNKELLLCVLLLGNNIANQAAVIVAERLVSYYFDAAAAAVVATLVLTPVLFVACEALPKQLFRQYSETWTYAISGVLEGSRWLLLPLTWIVVPFARLASRFAKERSSRFSGYRHDEYALERLLVASSVPGEPAVHQTALSVGSARSKPVTAAMIPLAETYCLDADASREAVREALAVARHTRYPLRSADGSFASYVYFLDPFLGPDPGASLASFGRDLVQLEPDCPLEDALARFEAVGSRVGIVEESGTTLGFVLAGDLVADLLAME